MNLSIIIVSYNVKYFLEQCLYSVVKAASRMDAEILVVDNQSSDDSLDYLRPKFPQVHFVGNFHNMGFAKANNQALSQALGKFVLFLNPDTIIGEEALKNCCAFLETHPEAGAVGVRMIDGSGSYLKESKRGFPGVWVAFCKLSGITALFPRSKVFARYYLGHLKEDENNAVEVLAGAFMMVKKETLDKTGPFDEQFFMYAEDIDLSYRIGKAGFLNYYLADQTIIHFKGESTRKDFRYVTLFYKAMSQFVAKHSGGGSTAVYTALMKGAIGLRSGISMLANAFKQEKVNVVNKTVKSFLQGSLIERETLYQSLTAAGRVVVDDMSQASEVIFCEGDDFSFQQIIDHLEKSSAHSKKVHAGKSKSIAGSDFSDNRGEAIPL